MSTRVTHEPKDVYEGGWASDRSFVFSISNPSSDYPLLQGIFLLIALAVLGANFIADLVYVLLDPRVR